MKLRTFKLFVSFIFSGFMVPLWSASSQGSSTASPSPTVVSTLEPSKIDPLVRVRQMVENDPRNARTSLRKRYRPTRSIFWELRTEDAPWPRAGSPERERRRGRGNAVTAPHAEIVWHWASHTMERDDAERARYLLGLGL